MSATQIKSVRWWHEQIVDYMLLCPDWTQGDMARLFGKTEAWLSTVINSDAFREYKALRFAEHQDGISKGVLERAEELAGLSLDVLTERIAKERASMSLRIVRETAETALKACGYGHKGPAVQINAFTQNNVSVDRETLERARQRLHDARDAQGVIEHEALPAPT